jgi:hypothetical protein
MWSGLCGEVFVSGLQKELSKQEHLFWTEATPLLPPGDTWVTTGLVCLDSPVSEVNVCCCVQMYRLRIKIGNNKSGFRKEVVELQV